ncbi:Peptidase family M48 [Musa troglodytarum]|uniref:Peptidase family M48 n=1 Tax=Musa troglodytarum TaxID=320322 RepID=A0A9E7KEC9_9LILI|nr:Peptidase family M48 [Musa troglodytarum]
MNTDAVISSLARLLLLWSSPLFKRARRGGNGNGNGKGEARRQRQRQRPGGNDKAARARRGGNGEDEARRAPDPEHASSFPGHLSAPSSFSSSAFSPLFFARAKPLLSPCSASTSAAVVAPRRSYYYAARPEVLHFRRKPRWYQNPRAALIVVVVGGTAAVTIYYGNLETVPYTKRRHFVLVSPAVERQLGDIRVRLISKEIIQALQRGLRHDDRRWSDLEYASESPRGEFDTPERARDTIWALSGKEEGKWSREDEVLDDRWVHQSRREGEARKSQPVTKHLEGLNWEILVVRDDTVNAFCLPGGKIVGFTGLLDHFRSDAEIATVIGHEVAHAIARHSAEMITKNLWFATLQLILLQFFAMPDLISAMSNLLLRLPFSRRYMDSFCSLLSDNLQFFLSSI